MRKEGNCLEGAGGGWEYYQNMLYKIVNEINF